MQQQQLLLRSAGTCQPLCRGSIVHRKERQQEVESGVVLEHGSGILMAGHFQGRMGLAGHRPSVLNQPSVLRHTAVQEAA